MAEESINAYLDDDALLVIFSHLESISDLVNAQKVCIRWKRLCRRLWRTVDTLACTYDGQYYISRRGDGQYEVIGTSGLREIFQYCGPFIKYFDSLMTDVEPVTFVSVMAVISEHCKNLEDIHIKLPPPPTTFRMRILLDGCMNLKKLYITNFTGEAEQDLIILRHQNIKLKSFSIALTESAQINGDFLKYLPPDVEEICFNNCFEGTRKFLLLELCQLRDLHSFKSIETPWFEEYLMEPEIIGYMNALVKLSLKNTFKLSSSYNYVANLINLKELTISDIDYLKDENLIFITNNCTQLEALTLEECDSITDRSIANICVSLQMLKSFKINSVNGITDEPIKQLPATLERFSCDKCNNVKHFGILQLMARARNCDITITVDHFIHTDSLLAGAIEIVKTGGTHHISFRIGFFHTTMSLVKNQSTPPASIIIQYLDVLHD